MALNNCDIYVNSTGRELKAHGTQDFPCAAYEHFLKRGEDITWHWHKELEAIYVEKGKLTVKIPEKQFDMTEGMLLLINSNILHYVVGAEESCLQSFVFSSELLGNSSGILHKKYIEPLLKCQAFDGTLWTMQDHPEVISEFCNAFQAIKRDDRGFEFSVSAALILAVKDLAIQFEDKFREGKLRADEESRIRIMLHFIHEHYQEALTLDEIAAQASIGKRECLRCFQKNIQIPPMQYLMKYRLMKAAEMLASETVSISDVAMHCGFEGHSNFSMQFKRYYGMTPRAYRDTILK